MSKSIYQCECEIGNCTAITTARPGRCTVNYRRPVNFQEIGLELETATEKHEMPLKIRTSTEGTAQKAEDFNAEGCENEGY